MIAITVSGIRGQDVPANCKTSIEGNVEGGGCRRVSGATSVGEETAVEYRLNVKLVGGEPMRQKKGRKNIFEVCSSRWAKAGIREAHAAGGPRIQGVARSEEVTIEYWRDIIYIY